MPLELYPSKPSIQVKNTLGVVSGKGGVGKSTLATQLALAFAQSGSACGLLDADFYGPSLRQMLREQTPPRVEEEKIHPAICSGIKVLSLAHFKPSEEGSLLRAPLATTLVHRFLTQVHWGSLDWLIIDFPPGTGDIGLSLLQKIAFDGAVVVTTPQQVALIDVERSLDMLKKMHTPVLGIVENMSYLQTTGQKMYPFGKDGGKRLAQKYALPFLGEVPLDPSLCQQCDSGALTCDSPFLKISRAIKAYLQEKRERPKVVKGGGKELILRFSKEKTLVLSYEKVQKNCPCARCKDSTSPKGSSDVRASAVVPIGNYALSFQFTTGCSNGIYPFELLNKLGRDYG